MSELEEQQRLADERRAEMERARQEAEDLRREAEEARHAEMEERERMVCQLSGCMFLSHRLFASLTFFSESVLSTL